jgi:hypothetical protein
VVFFAPNISAGRSMTGGPHAQGPSDQWAAPFPLAQPIGRPLASDRWPAPTCAPAWKAWPAPLASTSLKRGTIVFSRITYKKAPKVKTLAAASNPRAFALPQSRPFALP